MTDGTDHRDHLHRLALEYQAVSEWLEWIGLSLDAEDEEEREEAAIAAEDHRKAIFGDSLEEGLAAVDAYRRRILRRIAARKGELAEVKRQIEEPLRRDESLLETLDAQVERVMDQAKKRRVDHELVVVSLRNCPPSVCIDKAVPVELLPEDCKRVTVEPIKGAIKARLNKGELIPGCKLVRGRTVKWN